MYHDYKQSAASYQSAKAVLYEEIDHMGYGGWIKKPEELEYFVIS
jgi:hypothetical protein